MSKGQGSIRVQNANPKLDISMDAELYNSLGEVRLRGLYCVVHGKGVLGILVVVFSRIAEDIYGWSQTGERLPTITELPDRKSVV